MKKYHIPFTKKSINVQGLKRLTMLISLITLIISCSLFVLGEVVMAAAVLIICLSSFLLSLHFGNDFYRKAGLKNPLNL